MVTGGFTLVELLLVVAIISLLGALGIPSYQDYLVRTARAEMLVMVEPVKRKVAQFYAYRGKFPVNNAAAGLREPRRIRGRYTESVRVDHGALLVRAVNGELLSVRPLVNNVHPTGPVLWTCSEEGVDGFKTIGEYRSTIPAKHLPAECRW